MPFEADSTKLKRAQKVKQVNPPPPPAPNKKKKNVFEQLFINIASAAQQQQKGRSLSSDFNNWFVYFLEIACFTSIMAGVDVKDDKVAEVEWR